MFAAQEEKVITARRQRNEYNMDTACLIWNETQSNHWLCTKQGTQRNQRMSTTEETQSDHCLSTVQGTQSVCNTKNTKLQAYVGNTRKALNMIAVCLQY